jgi:epsilon-lactone hydrolase
MVSPEALKLNEILRNAPKAVDMDLPHQREAGEHAEDMTSEPVGVTYEEAYEVDGLWATPESWDGESAIMYLYGGGYVISSPHSRRKLAGHLANASRARTLVPRYHLAPERTVVAGDSSAGGLAVAMMLKLREDGASLPAGGVPISPWPAAHGRPVPSRGGSAHSTGLPTVR